MEDLLDSYEASSMLIDAVFCCFRYQMLYCNCYVFFFVLQSQPVLKLQTEDDEQTNSRVLTCFLLPQQGLGSLGE